MGAEIGRHVRDRRAVKAAMDATRRSLEEARGDLGLRQKHRSECQPLLCVDFAKASTFVGGYRGSVLQGPSLTVSLMRCKFNLVDNAHTQAHTHTLSLSHTHTDLTTISPHGPKNTS